MTPVKICGVTRREDAVLAAALGASAVGFVLWSDSPRYISPSGVRAIVGSLPPFVAAVGVFVDETPEVVARIAAEAGITAIQLHGKEDVRAFRHLPWRIIKSVSVRGGTPPAELAEVPADVPVLLDAFDPVRRGGTGQSIDWQVAARIAVERSVILSGGLRPDNVAAAIAAVAPAAVDVSSGVEREPGVKDPARLRALFEAVAGGDR